MFDLVAYKKRAGRLAWQDLDFSTFRSQPLSGPVLRCLAYMHDVEYHTACYLRDILVTPAHADPDVTAFLSIWAYEELWHGEALGEVLAAHGEPSGGERVGPLRRGLGWRDHARPFLMAAGGWLAGQDFVALQMAWGALNESMTKAGYSLLAERAGHPVLGELLRRVMRQEALHLGFYTSEARRRLESSSRARRLTREVLARVWQPVGSRVMPEGETRFVLGYLLGGGDGQRQAERLDRRLDHLPGLAGLGLVSKVVSQIHPEPEVVPNC